MDDVEEMKNDEDVVIEEGEINVADEGIVVEEELIDEVETTEANNLTQSERPRRAASKRGIKRLEINLDNSKEYASTLGHQFTMKKKKNSCIRKNESFMHIAANVLFAQVTEHSQMSAKAGI